MRLDTPSRLTLPLWSVNVDLLEMFAIGVSARAGTQAVERNE
ncbi:hypothetical protein [Granulosicoccus sp. 3-233]